MRAAAAPLVGRHDFAAFQASDCACDHAVRDLTRLDVATCGGGRLEVVVEATAFVKHMVRNIVGTLVECGQGRRDPGSIPALLAGGDRTRAGRTAPAHGLCLDEVFYAPEGRPRRSP
jgi:tRNA pseudouridine38-40 synthase